MAILRRKQTHVEAYLHDGSDTMALQISQFINEHKGKAIAILRGHSDISKDYAVVRLLDNVLTNLIVPGFWIVNLGEGKFIAVPNAVMMDAYDIEKE